MKMLRNMSLVLVVVLLIAISGPVFAVTMDNSVTTVNTDAIILEEFGTLFSSLATDATLFGVDFDNYEDFELLSPIQWINTQNTDNSATTLVQFPMLNSVGDVELIYSIIITDSGYNSVLSKDFAPLIDAAMKSNMREVLLIQDNLTLYAVGEEGVLCFEDNMVMGKTHAELTTAVTNCIGISQDKSCLLEVDEHITAIAKASCDSTARRITPYGSTIDAARTLSGYPIVSQGNYGLCWAASISSIAKYVGSPYSAMTITEIADQMNIGYNTGATISQCRTALSNMLGSGYYAAIKGRVLSVAEIQEEINAYDPVFLKLSVNTLLYGTQYHASVLMGYDISVEAFKIRVMDPLVTSGYVVSTYNGTSWTYTARGHTFTWIDTIII